jgi:hypothetical protein
MTLDSGLLIIIPFEHEARMPEHQTIHRSQNQSNTKLATASTSPTSHEHKTQEEKQNSHTLKPNKQPLIPYQTPLITLMQLRHSIHTSRRNQKNRKSKEVQDNSHASINSVGLKGFDCRDRKYRYM